MDMFPQLVKLNDKTEHKIYKNRKISVMLDRAFEFIFNTVICNGKFYHLVTIHNIDKIAMFRKPKMLICLMDKAISIFY